MILNETYDDVLLKLNDYGLVEEGALKNLLSNKKLLKQAMKSIDVEIHKIPECKKFKYYFSNKTTNIIANVVLEENYPDSKKEKIKSEIGSAIDNVLEYYNKQFKSGRLHNFDIKWKFSSRILPKTIGITFMY